MKDLDDKIEVMWIIVASIVSLFIVLVIAWSIVRYTNGPVPY